MKNNTISENKNCFQGAAARTEDLLDIQIYRALCRIVHTLGGCFRARLKNSSKKKRKIFVLSPQKKLFNHIKDEFHI